LRVLSAEFVTSATSGARGIPRDDLAQIALAGRSNVGKSSLINALCRKTIARTSAAPGKTRLANVYRITLAGARRRQLYLVDLPGYGYARGGTDSANELAAVAEAYFQNRIPKLRKAASDPGPRNPVPGGALLLVDSRHPGLEADRHAFDWLTRMSAAPRVVATKVDKLSRAERTRNLTEIERVFGMPPLPVSASTGEGLDELWKIIVKVGKL
jgi:GTP-binding protein